MTALGLHGDVSVRRVRVRDDGADQLATALRARRLVSAAALRPPGLPPSAVLLVRSLPDPLPHGLRLDDDLAPHVWQAAVAERLDRVARSAARPATGPVAADAAAVLFDDTATMLACLARDHAHGMVADRWWWRLVAARVGGVLDTAEALASAPREVPAVFELLAGRGEAALAAAALGEPGARAVLRAMLTAHGIPAVDRREPAALPAHVARPVSTRPTVRGDRASAPWEAVVPEAQAPDLGPVAQELLGTALLLRRRPSAARVVTFAGAVARWRATAPAPERRSGTRSPPTDRPRRETAVRAPAAPVPARPPAAQAGSVAAVSRPAKGGRAPAGFAASEPPADLTAPRTAPADPSRPATAGDAAATAAPAAPGSDVPAVGPAAPVTTELGGLFYLLNAALALELYGDFTTPLSPGLALDPWDFVALLGAHLIDAPRPADPAWALLAALAGRPADRPPGAGLAAPRAWRAPAAWLAPFGNAPLELRRPAGERLVLWHPAGFPAVDVARRGPLGAQRAHERGRRPPAGAPGPVRATAHTIRRRPLERWVGWVGAYLRIRLGALLDAPDGPSLARRLFAHDAAVHVTPTHVDVVLSLAGLPLEIRRGGLDRNPGWIPAAGRHVAFHFE